jgi:subtilisin family serine protease
MVVASSSLILQYQDGYGHGTHVAGTIGAADNNIGVVGVAPEAEVFVVRVFGDDGRFRASGVVAAARECQKGGAHVINLSLGGKNSNSAEHEILKELFNDYGILSIAAAGNSASAMFEYPASYDIVMSVAAVDSNSNRVGFSTYNNQVDVAAPGANILSLRAADSGTTYMAGTSMAVPHVVGAAALLKSFKLDASPGEIRQAIELTAIDLGTPGRDDYFGRGLIDVEAAMNMIGPARETPIPSPTASPSTSPSTSPSARPSTAPSSGSTASTPFPSSHAKQCSNRGAGEGESCDSGGMAGCCPNLICLLRDNICVKNFGGGAGGRQSIRRKRGH